MAFLKITSGELKGTKFQIDRDEVVIGRVPENVVHLDDPSVSGRHCVIRRDGRRFTLTDFKSTNGTRLNDVRIQSYRLSAKDRICVGSVEMIFDGDDIEDAHPTQIPPTIVRPAAKAPKASEAEPAAAPSSFEKRQSSKGLWVGLSVMIGLLAIGALAWFLMSLFAS
jgi:predicted component of type VI protein secretion system